MSAACASAVENPDRWLYRLGETLEAAATVAAARLGILDYLHETPACANQAARHCGTAPGVTRLLLDALDALGVLRRSEDGKYATTAAAGWFTTLAPGWSRLDQVVRTGQPLIAADTPAGAADFYPEIVDLPDVIPTTRRMVEAAGLTAQFQFLAGDMFTVDLPQATYDMILLGNVCHPPLALLTCTAPQTMAAAPRG
jgi:Dimerisation domain/O-methyltransferase domain